MDILLSSTLLVALAELGDKTQLLAILLATRFHRPLPIIAGILAATLANHALAAFVGSRLADVLDGTAFRAAVALAFLAMAAWALIPDKLEENEAKPSRFGPFLTTLVAFFLVEMGDKTQIATAALGARFHDVGLVAAGTTIGMMLANVPAVYLGKAILRVVPLAKVRIGAAVVFALLGLWALAEALGWL
jgi:putative Ca2+/H+ antiporter (TMEM165/GDT1 family)